MTSSGTWVVFPTSEYLPCGYFYLPAQLCLLITSCKSSLAVNSSWTKPDTRNVYGMLSRRLQWSSPIREVPRVRELPPEPPYDDKKPKDEDDKDDVPKPAAPLAFCHVVHTPERASEYARRFCECVVLSHFQPVGH